MAIHQREKNKAKNAFLTVVLIIAGLALVYHIVLRSWFSVVNCFVTGSQWNYDSMTCESLPPASKVIEPKDFVGVLMKVPGQDREVIIGTIGGRDGMTPVGDWGDVDEFDKGTVMIDLKDAVYINEYIVTPVLVEFGGTGSFYYLTSFSIGDDLTITHQDDYQAFGDRVIIDSLSAESAGDGVLILLKYRTRGEDQSYAEEPKVFVEEKYVFKNGVLGKAK